MAEQTWCNAWRNAVTMLFSRRSAAVRSLHRSLTSPVSGTSRAAGNYRPVRIGASLPLQRSLHQSLKAVMSASTTTTLYLDFKSPPARSCGIFVKLNNLPVELSIIDLLTQDNLEEKYLTMFPLGQVPYLQDGSFGLSESSAILSYLASKYDVPEHWYPRSNLQDRVRVDAALHWYHRTLRDGCSTMCYQLVITPMLGLSPNKEKVEEGIQMTHKSLKQLSTYWLQGGERPFVAGSEVSVADLLLLCDLDQCILLRKEKHSIDLEELLESYPLVRDWMNRVRETCGAAYEEGTTALRAVDAMVNAAQ